MATFKFKGLDEYVRKLESLDGHTEEMLGNAIYKGADVVADSIKKALESLPVDNRIHAEEKQSISQVQKQGLIMSFGIAKLKDDRGFRNVKLGFDGYNKVKTKKYPQGQPNVMIARSLESGTSYMPKNRVISKAANSAKKECEKVMQETIEQSINKIM